MELVIADEIRNDLTNFAMNVRGPATSLWEDSPDDGQCVEDYLESYGLWIAAGTGDIQRNIIGERVLGLPKDDKSRTSHRD
jgi:alkylation response protein AidB-like acyl-CoA dehydrogenase